MGAMSELLAPEADAPAAERRDGRARQEHAVAFRVLDAAGIAALPAAQWDALSSRALEENPYYARQHLLAGLEALPGEADLRVLTVRSRCDDRLVGLFPFRKGRFAPLMPLTRAEAAVNLYQVSGTPLVDAREAGRVIEAFLDRLGHGGVPRFWKFPHVDCSGPFARLLSEAAAAAGLVTLRAHGYERPLLTRQAEGFEHHVETVLGRKRAKEIQRALRRLREMGELTFERATEPRTVHERVEQFLALEHSGWKGAQGTSFLSRPDHARFARHAYGGGAGGMGLASVDSLLLDGLPIAMSVNIGRGGAVFTPKCAFDETYRRFGPGLVLEYLVIEAFYADETVSQMDASTTADNHVVAGLWNASKPMGTLVLGPHGLRTRLLAKIEETDRKARKLAKRLIKRD